ncbi:MAG: hypothetical protein JJU11_18355 [Candidatus Sumerlaeia bacterium]|nr:hypothetical protein [Candidatus Sumerlaeia bacterium]
MKPFHLLASTFLLLSTMMQSAPAEADSILARNSALMEDDSPWVYNMKSETIQYTPDGRESKVESTSARVEYQGRKYFAEIEVAVYPDDDLGRSEPERHRYLAVRNGDEFSMRPGDSSGYSGTVHVYTLDDESILTVEDAQSRGTPSYVHLETRFRALQHVFSHSPISPFHSAEFEIERFPARVPRSTGEVLLEDEEVIYEFRITPPGEIPSHFSEERRRLFQQNMEQVGEVVLKRVRFDRETAAIVAYHQSFPVGTPHLWYEVRERTEDGFPRTVVEKRFHPRPPGLPLSPNIEDHPIALRTTYTLLERKPLEAVTAATFSRARLDLPGDDILAVVYESRNEVAEIKALRVGGEEYPPSQAPTEAD